MENNTVIKKYDERGNEIYFKRDRYEVCKEYNENNKLIHRKDSNGYEEWWEYNEKGNLIHYKNSNGEEIFY